MTASAIEDAPIFGRADEEDWADMATSDSKEMQAILDFVSGSLSAEDFKEQLCANSAFEKILDDASEIDPSSYIGQSTYHFLLTQDFRSPGDVLSVQGALIQFLDRRGVSYEKTDKYEKLFDLLLSAQPSWLDVDMSFLKDHVLAGAPDLNRTDLKKWLREKLRTLFRCADKPPKWIQSPNWPIRDNQPLVFLGQFSVKNYFHDNASVYVFHDPVARKYETIVQSY